MTMPDQLVQIIGKTATRKLREAAARGVFGPRGMLYVRRRDTDAQSRRNRRIVSLYRRKRDPWSMQRLKSEFGLSERQLRNIVSAA
jgi:hypothetical protein